MFLSTIKCYYLCTTTCRVIQLENGLVALLISDLKDGEEMDEGAAASESEDEEDEKEEGEGGDNKDDDDDDDDDENEEDTYDGDDEASKEIKKPGHKLVIY